MVESQIKNMGKINNEFTGKKIIGLASAILAVGIILIFYSRHIDYRKTIPDAIERGVIQLPAPGKRNAVYYIKKINTGCQTCTRYHILKNQPGVHVTFMLGNDFSDNDIENFRSAFKIEPQHTVHRVEKGWQDVFETCLKHKDENILVLINENNVLTKLWRF